MESYQFENSDYSITSDRHLSTYTDSPESYIEEFVEDFDFDNKKTYYHEFEHISSTMLGFLAGLSEPFNKENRDIRSVFTIKKGQFIEEDFITEESYEVTLLSDKYIVAEQSSYEVLKGFIDRILKKEEDIEDGADYRYLLNHEWITPDKFNLEQYRTELKESGVQDFTYQLSDDRFGGAETEEQLIETINNFLEAHTDEIDRPRRGRAPTHGWRNFLDILTIHGQETVRIFHPSGNVLAFRCEDKPIHKLFKSLSADKKILIIDGRIEKAGDSLWDFCNESQFSFSRSDLKLSIDGYDIGVIYTHFEDSTITFDEDITEEAFRAFVEANNNAINWNEKAIELAQKFSVELPEVAVSYPVE